MSQKSCKAISRDFSDLVGSEQVMSDETDLHAYSYDAAVLDPVLPSLVVRPQKTEALGEIVALCNRR